MWQRLPSLRYTAPVLLCVGLASACDLPSLRIPKGNGGVGDPCESLADCRPGLACVEGSCQPAGDLGQGAPCELSASCSEGLYCGPLRTCDPAGNVGENGACQTTADCQKGLICNFENLSAALTPIALCRPAGTLDIDDPCASDLECLAGLSCTLDASSGLRSCQSRPGNIISSLPSWPGESCSEDSGPARAYFDLPRSGVTQDFYRLPFPNDARLDANGRIDLSGHPSPGTALPVDVLSRYFSAIQAEVGGFSRVPVVFFRFSRSYQFESLSNDPLQRFRLVDITPSSPEYGQRKGYEIVGYPDASDSKYICSHWAALTPNRRVPLRPSTTYAVILERGVLGADGTPFEPSADLSALLAATAPTDPVQQAAYARYAPLRAFLANGAVNAGLSAAQILNAAVFTTGDPEAVMPAIRNGVQALPANYFTVQDLMRCDSGAPSPCADGSPERSCTFSDPASPFIELHGRVTLPILQQGIPPYESAGGNLAIANGSALVQRAEPVCFSLTLPRNAALPAGGFPVVLYGHGTGGSFAGVVRSGLAAELAGGVAGDPNTIAAAVLAIEMPQHGARRGASQVSPELLFYNFANPQAALGNLLQGSADFFALRRALPSIASAADALINPLAFSSNTGRVVLFGHSQGSNHGSIALPYMRALASESVSSALWSGLGGDLSHSLLSKTQPINIAAGLPAILLDREPSGALPGGVFHPLLALFQTYFDRADSVNYAWRYRQSLPSGGAAHHVFMTYGLGDSYSPEPTLQAFARAAALAHVNPVLVPFGLSTVAAPLSANASVAGQNWTQGLRQYTPPAGVDGHFVATQSGTPGRSQAVRFLRQALAGQTPVIRD